MNRYINNSIYYSSILPIKLPLHFYHFFITSRIFKSSFSFPPRIFTSSFWVRSPTEL